MLSFSSFKRPLPSFFSTPGGAGKWTREGGYQHLVLALGTPHSPRSFSCLRGPPTWFPSLPSVCLSQAPLPPEPQAVYSPRFPWFPHPLSLGPAQASALKLQIHKPMPPLLSPGTAYGTFHAM